MKLQIPGTYIGILFAYIYTNIHAIRTIHPHMGLDPTLGPGPWAAVGPGPAPCKDIWFMCMHNITSAWAADRELLKCIFSF